MTPLFLFGVSHSSYFSSRFPILPSVMTGCLQLCLLTVGASLLAMITSKNTTQVMAVENMVSLYTIDKCSFITHAATK